ncbi:hypothetical protein [Siminovitchia terrae]|uniref:hypothetical protein n=1 Tax=Siminovitchia terrae TaxID=1914933 RepID=UPI0028ADC730|nr:hypothetical protein [Siminovitchia terrae]
MFKKSFFILISVVLLTFSLTPITSNANNNEEQIFDNSNTKVIEDSDDKMVTQIEVDDKIYEYVELISSDIIETEVYEINGENRILVDTITTKIVADGDQLEILKMIQAQIQITLKTILKITNQLATTVRC